MDRPHLPIRRRVRLYRCIGHRRREDQRHGPDADRMADDPLTAAPARPPRKPVEVRFRRGAGKWNPDNS